MSQVNLSSKPLLSIKLSLLNVLLLTSGILITLLPLSTINNLPGIVTLLVSPPTTMSKVLDSFVCSKNNSLFIISDEAFIALYHGISMGLPVALYLVPNFRDKLLTPSICFDVVSQSASHINLTLSPLIRLI